MSKVKDFLSKVGGKFADVAEIGGKLLGNTPAGTVLSTIGGLLKNKANGDTEEAKVAQELLLELETRRHEFEMDIAKLQNEELESARKWNAEIQTDVNATKLAKYTPYIIDLFVSTLWGALTVYICMKGMNLIEGKPMDISDGIWGLYATITGAFTTVLGFHRGSSIGSKQKDKLKEV